MVEIDLQGGPDPRVWRPAGHPWALKFPAPGQAWFGSKVCRPQAWGGLGLAWPLLAVAPGGEVWRPHSISAPKKHLEADSLF